MKETSKKCFVLSAVLFACFVVFTALVRLVDVKMVEATGTEIGFATMNMAIHEAIGVNNLWYEITEWLGYIAIGVALGFALFAGLQLIKGKSLKKVDSCLIALGCFYVIVVCFYVLFEIVEINYRPIFVEGELEASYPSSHTMLGICIFATAIILFSKYIKRNKSVRIIANAVATVLLLVTVVGRFLSGYHWTTDIIGGIILSTSLVCIYAGVFNTLSKNK